MLSSHAITGLLDTAFYATKSNLSRAYHIRNTKKALRLNFASFILLLIPKSGITDFLDMFYFFYFNSSSNISLHRKLLLRNRYFSFIKFIPFIRTLADLISAVYFFDTIFEFVFIWSS